MFDQDPLPKEQNTALKLILLVEDDDANAEVLDLALTQEFPCLVRHAHNGVEALQAVEEMKPNVLIIDYQLPVTTGLELYDQLQARPALASVPALFLSASTHQDEIESRHLPFLAKPYELETLLERVHQLLA